MTNAMPKEICEAISKVMKEVGYIQKKGTNTFHNYKFAAVGDLLAKVQPAMVDAGLVIVQSELSHQLMGEDSVMTAGYEFTLLHTSGAQWDEKPRHTGMAGARNSKGGYDDKALNKCHTAARKYFLLALFQIPTGDVADPDEEEDKPQQVITPYPQQANPSGPDRKAAATKWANDAIISVNGFNSGEELAEWKLENVKAIAAVRSFNEALHGRLTKAIHDRAKELHTPA